MLSFIEIPIGTPVFIEKKSRLIPATGHAASGFVIFSVSAIEVRVSRPYTEPPCVKTADVPLERGSQPIAQPCSVLPGVSFSGFQAKIRLIARPSE